LKYYTILEVLDALDATPKGTEKLEILKHETDNIVLQHVFSAAYNPYVNYYIKKIPSSYEKQENDFGTSLFKVLSNLKVLSERQLTGDAASKWLGDQLESLSGEDAEVLERIIGRDMRCGVSASTVNKVWHKLIPSYPCMLASSYNKKNLENIKFPAVIQEKLDGGRFNFLVEGNKVSIFGRSGKPIDLLGVMDEEILKFAHALPEAYSSGVVLDGELLVVDDNSSVLPRKTGNGILSKAGKGTITEDEAKQVRFVMWDIIPLHNFKEAVAYTLPYKDRWGQINDVFQTSSLTTISLPVTEIVNNLTDAKSFFTRMLQDGKEGAILKNMYSVWENKRSKDQVKLKVEVEFEMEVVAAEEGSGKYVGKLGALLCSSKDGGITVAVGSGFSDAQRKEYWDTDMRGKIITMKGNEVIEDSKEGDKSIFLPIFIEVREDKTLANTEEEISMLFEEATS